MTRPILLALDQNSNLFELPGRNFDHYYHVIHISYVRQAMEVADRKAVIGAMIYHHLPENDGLTMLDSLKKSMPAIKVIFICKKPTVELVITAFRLGAYDFLIQPVKPFELMASLDRMSNMNPENTIDQAPNGLNIPLKNGDQPVSNHWKSFIKNPIQAGLINLLQKIDPNLEIKRRTDINQFQIKNGVTAQKGKDYLYTNFMENDHVVDMEFVNLPVIEGRFLGKFEAKVNNIHIEKLLNKKSKSLFAYILFNHKRKISRDILMEKFWPNSTLESARNCLNVCLHSIRKVLHELDPIREFIQFEDECYYINREVSILLDVNKFITYWKKGRQAGQEDKVLEATNTYAKAAALYNGDFLEDYLYADWTELERQNLREIFLVILDQLSHHYLKNKQYSSAIKFCKKMLSKDNCREDIHRRLMLCYQHIDQRDAAIKQYIKCAHILKKELDVLPSKSTIVLYEEIKRGYLDVNPQYLSEI